MKNILYILLLATVMSCSSKKPSITYNIAINTDSTIKEGATAYLSTYNQNQPIDSVVVVNGKAFFSDTISQPSILRIDLNRSYANILIENSDEVTVDMSLGKASTINDDGGINDRYTAINDQIQAKLPLLKEHYDALLKGGATSSEAMKKIEISSFIGIEKSIIENKDNLIGSFLLWQMLQLDVPTLEKTDSLIQIVKFANQLDPINNIRNNIAKAEYTQIGKMFVDFEGTDIKGNSIKLSDYVGNGKYVLVDFWASWCGPCMAELPNIKAAYDKYNGEKFTVIGVNVWDKRAPFINSVKEKQMSWNQIFTKGEEVTNLYGIQGIPELILFAPDGTILTRGVDIRGENIVDKIGEFIEL